MSQSHETRWNSKAIELLEKYENEIVFVEKKVRGGFTYSTIINALIKGLKVVFVCPTSRLVDRELNKIIKLANSRYNLDINEWEVIKWEGKKRVCQYEDESDPKYSFGQHTCSSCDLKDGCEFNLTPKFINKIDWKIVGLTHSKLENIYGVKDEIFHYKKAINTLLSRTDIVVFDECRYLTASPSFYHIGKYKLYTYLSKKLAKNIKVVLKEKGLYNIDPNIGFKARKALFDMLNPEENFTDLIYNDGFEKPAEKVIKVENEHNLDSLEVYYAVLAGFKKSTNLNYPRVLDITPLLSSDSIYRYRNGRFEVKPSILGKWGKRGEICQEFKNKGATVFLSDATNRIEDIERCLNIPSKKVFNWGDPQSISKTQLIICDDRESIDNIFLTNTEKKKRQKERIEDLIWDTKDLTKNESFILSLSKEKLNNLKNWDLPEEISPTYYRSELCTGVSFEGRLGIFLGLPHTPRDSFQGEGFERIEEDKIDFNYPKDFKDLEPPADKLEWTKGAPEEVIEYVKKKNYKRRIRRKFEEKLRWQEIKEQFIQTSGKLLDPLGENKSVVISVFTKIRELKEKIYGNRRDDKKPVFTKTLVKGKHEEDAKIIIIAWLNDIFEKCNIDDPPSFGVYARLYNRYIKNNKIPNLSQALRYWEGKKEWEKNHPDLKLNVKASST